jgi:hypothetical protein
MQKLAGEGPSAARVQQLPAVTGVSVQVPGAESQNASWRSRRFSCPGYLVVSPEG